LHPEFSFRPLPCFDTTITASIGLQETRDIGELS
jgi:hypothetical protein